MKNCKHAICGVSLARRSERIALFFGLALATFPQQAWGHASLVHSSPAPYTRLERPPRQVELVFNERIESVFHSLRIVDSHGNEIETEAARTADGGETLLTPVSTLAPGEYGVYWRINSLDGHQVQGQFGFGVASDPPSEAQVIAWKPTAGRGLPPWFFPVIKGLGLLALSIWFGFYIVLVLAGGTEKASVTSAISHDFVRRAARLSRVGGAAFLLLELLALAAKTAAFTGGSLLSALNPANLMATLTGSSYGEWWAIRFAAGVLLLLLGIAARWRATGDRWLQAISWVLAAVIIISIAVTGHAQAATGNLLLAETMQGLHLAASIFWAGGLFYLGIGAGTALDSVEAGPNPPSETSVQWLSSIAPRFSRLAQACVATIFVTGIYNSWIHIPSWTAFVTTGYGRTLLGKLFWVLLTLLVAFINWRKVLPELSRLRHGMLEKLRWVPRFQLLLQSEFAGCVIIFATVAMLTNMPPASADPQASPRELRATSGAYEVLLRVEPARLGTNTVTVTLLGASGERLSDARKVTIYLRSLEMDMGLATGEALPGADGSYSSEMTFSMNGRWRVSVEVLPALGEAFVVEYDLTIS
jgi:copper transport protein